MLWMSVRSFAFKMVTELHWQFSKVGYLEESLVGDFFNDKWNWFLCSDDWNFNRVWWIHGLHTFALFEAKAFEQNINLHGFAICSDVVCSTEMCGQMDYAGTFIFSW